MKRFFECAAGYGVSAAFIFGVWSFGHFILKASDTTMMLCGWWLLFTDLDKDTERDLTLAVGEIEFLLPALGAGDYRVVQVLEQSLNAMKRALGNWLPINTAPRDGRSITVKREHEGRIIYEGPAAWRTVHFPAIAPDPLGRPALPEDAAYDATGWMYPVDAQDKRVPEPTHWKP